MDLQKFLRDLSVWISQNPATARAWDKVALRPDQPGDDQTGWSARSEPEDRENSTLHMPQDDNAPLLVENDQQQQDTAERR